MNCIIDNSINYTGLSMMQGDTYVLPIKIKAKDYIVKDVNVEKIVFQFGTIEKVYPSEDVEYLNERFIVKFSQEDTLSLNSHLYAEYQATVLFTDGSRKSTKLYSLEIFKTLIGKEIKRG